jgi:hypothetical protein
MPDKRDMHKAKSHRNSKSSRQQNQAQERRGRQPEATTMTQTTTISPEMESDSPELAPNLRRKKNRS